MTPADYARMIPDAVVEAAAIESVAGFDWATGDPMWRDAVRKNTRAALAAGLAGWPNAIKGESLFDGQPTLFLPLPKEAADE